MSLDSPRNCLGALTYVLVLSEEGQVQDNGKRAGVSGHDHKLGGTAVERLGALVGTLEEELA
jgi:hypothetical protein